MKKLELHPSAASLVVKGFDKFVSDIDLSKFEGLKPTAGRVIVKMFEDKPGENKQSGFIIPGEEGDKQEIGVIVAASECVVNPYMGGVIKTHMLAGDVVILPEHFGHAFVVGDEREKLTSVMYTDIIAKL